VLKNKPVCEVKDKGGSSPIFRATPEGSDVIHEENITLDSFWWALGAFCGYS
jgi:hypothetical protein